LREHNIRSLCPPLAAVRSAFGEVLPADVAEIDYILGKQLGSPGLLSRGQAMADFNDEHEAYKRDSGIQTGQV
jgi:hypothetical protein